MLLLMHVVVAAHWCWSLWPGFRCPLGKLPKILKPWVFCRSNDWVSCLTSVVLTGRTARSPQKLFQNLHDCPPSASSKILMCTPSLTTHVLPVLHRLTALKMLLFNNVQFMVFRSLRPLRYFLFLPCEIYYNRNCWGS